MAKRVTDAEREAIIAELPTGKSCNEIARQFKRSPSTIGRIAADVGHVFGHTNLIRAHEARAAYDDERRANLRLEHVEAVERILKELAGPTLVYNFGGRDNTFNSRELERAPARELRDLTQAVRNLMTTVLEMDKRDVGAADRGILDLIFDQIATEAANYDPTGTAEDSPADASEGAR